MAWKSPSAPRGALLARRRLLILLAMLPVVVTVAAALYMVGMRELEGRPRDFLFAADDAVYVCGSHKDTQRFSQEFT